MFGFEVAMALMATIIFPCLIGMLFFKSLPLYYRLIVALLLFGFLTEVTLITLSFLRINNLFSSHLYALVEIILLSLYFRRLAKTSKEKNVISTIMIVLSGFAIVYSIIGSNIAEFNSIPRALECIYFSVLACYAFYNMALEPPEKEDVSLYFVNGAILLYFSSCFIVFAFSKSMTLDTENLLFMHNVHSLVSATCNIAYAIGLWLASRSSYSVA